jgi:hypothetical protein
MTKEIRVLVREIEDNGFHCQQGRTHIVVLMPDKGGRVASLPLSPGRGRWLQNLRSDLRRKGVL